MKMKTLFLGLLGIALAVSQVAAQAVYDGGGADDNWSTADNWVGDVAPSSGDNVVIGDMNTSGTIDYDAGTFSINDLRLGSGASVSGGSGTMNLNSGALTSTGWTFIGVDGNSTTGPTTTGTLNIGGTGSFTATQRVYLGLGGGAGTGANDGTINISGGSLTADVLVFGANDGNNGVINQSGGTVTGNSWMTVGETAGATGEYNISGGSLTSGDFSIAQNGATTGELNASGTSSISVSGLWAGRGEFGAGDASQATVSIDGSNVSFDVSGDAHFGGFNFGASNTFGTLSFTADASGVSSLDVAGNIFLNDGSVEGGSTLLVDLSAYGSTSDDILLVDVGAGGDPIGGAFANYAEGDVVAGSGGRTITYVGGDGNDIVLLGAVTIPEPTSALIIGAGVLGLIVRRRRR